MSVCKPFFLGEIDSDLLFPYPTMTADEGETLAILLDSLERFAEEHIDSRAIDREARLPKEVIDGLGELGILGIVVPEAYGGFGGSAAFYAKVTEALAGTDGSVVVTVGAHQSIGYRGILLFGTEEQKRRFLPEVASGERLAAFALTEPGAGSDAAAIRTRATWDEGRGAWILNGTKIWITNGGIAGVYTVFAQTEVEVEGARKDRITAFIVPRELPGVSTGPEEHKLGIRGSSTTEVHFENVELGPDLLLGEVGHGFKVAMEILNSGRLYLSAGCVGGMKHVLREATAHAAERVQFGRPIAEFELIQAKLAGMAVEIYAAEAMVELTTGLVDRGVEDTALECAICKFSTSEALWRVVNEALQIAGGMGYMQEYPYERYLRDSRIDLIFEGTNEILRLYTALAGLERPGERLREVAKALHDPVKQLGLLTGYAKTRARRAIGGPDLPELHPDMAPLGETLSTWVAEFAGAVEWALRRHGKSIIQRQMDLERIANAVAELYRMAAIVSRAEAARRSGDELAAEAHLTRARLAVDGAFRGARRAIRAMRSNLDNDVRVVAAEILAAEGAYLPHAQPAATR